MRATTNLCYLFCWRNPVPIYISRAATLFQASQENLNLSKPMVYVVNHFLRISSDFLFRWQGSVTQVFTQKVDQTLGCILSIQDSRYQFKVIELNVINTSQGGDQSFHFKCDPAQSLSGHKFIIHFPQLLGGDHDRSNELKYSTDHCNPSIQVCIVAPLQFVRMLSIHHGQCRKDRSNRPNRLNPRWSVFRSQPCTYHIAARNDKENGTDHQGQRKNENSSLERRIYLFCHASAQASQKNVGPILDTAGLAPPYRTAHL